MADSFTLHLADQIIEKLPSILTEIFYSRPFRNGGGGKNNRPIVFNSIVTQRDDEYAVGSLNEQRAALPQIIIRETSTELSTDGGNAYISSRDGMQIGRTNDGKEIITLHYVPITVTVEVKIRNDDEAVNNHLRDTMIKLSYGDYYAGDITLKSPHHEFPIILKLPQAVSKTPIMSETTSENINEMNFTLTFRTYIADVSLTPTIGEVVTDIYLTDTTTYPTALEILDSSDKSADIEPKWQPSLNFRLNAGNMRN